MLEPLSVHLLHRLSGAIQVEDELLEERPRELGGSNARDLGELASGISRTLNNPGSEIAEAFGPSECKIHRSCNRPQGRGCAGKVLALVTTDKAGPLPRHKTKAELTLDHRGSQPNQEGRILANDSFVVGARDEAGLAAAALHRHAKWLKVADGDIGAIASGRRHDTKRYWIDSSDSERSVMMRQLTHLGTARVHDSEKGRTLEIDRRRAAADRRAEAAHVDEPGGRVEGNFDDLNIGAGRHPDDLAPLDADLTHDDDLTPAGDPCCHPQRDRRRIAPVVTW